MSKAALLKKRKHKKRLRRLNIIPTPILMTIDASSSAELLSQAYPISIYWDNDLDAYIAELADFGGVQIHAATWQAAAVAAKIAHERLIIAYRLYNYPLPEV